MLLYLCFFCSGLSGLIYQVVWVRMFGNVFGNTIYSASIVVAVFMLGLGVGSYAVGRWADRRYRGPSGIAASRVRCLRAGDWRDGARPCLCPPSPWPNVGIGFLVYDQRQRLARALRGVVRGTSRDRCPSAHAGHAPDGRYLDTAHPASGSDQYSGRETAHSAPVCREYRRRGRRGLPHGFRARARRWPAKHPAGGALVQHGCRSRCFLPCAARAILPAEAGSHRTQADAGSRQDARTSVPSG